MGAVVEKASFWSNKDNMLKVRLMSNYPSTLECSRGQLGDEEAVIA